MEYLYRVGFSFFGSFPVVLDSTCRVREIETEGEESEGKICGEGSWLESNPSQDTDIRL